LLVEKVIAFVFNPARETNNNMNVILNFIGVKNKTLYWKPLSVFK
jgi:hypothetical protein